MKYGDISPAVAAYSVTNMLNRAKSQLDLSAFTKSRRTEVKIDPLTITCRVCEAPAGAACRPVRRHFNWVGSKHAERIDDARVIAEAVEALNPDQSAIKPGDTVTFRPRGRFKAL